VTITLCVSASGEKIAPQLIGKSKQPQGFPKASSGSTPLSKWGVHYDHTETSWQNHVTMTKYLQQLNAKARLWDQNFFVVWDNASCHTKAAKLLDPSGWYNIF